jgi:two-component system nitrogen regulation sensor histidine kinase NtrY
METDVRAEGEQKRRRREFYIILGVIPFLALLTYIESHLSIISGDVPIAANILVLGLINFNVILLVLLVFLVMRNTAKLFLESRSRVMGSKLRTKLIAAFVGLTMVPTFILFFFVVGFINKSIDAWFNIQIETSLEESLVLAKNYYKDTTAKTTAAAQRLAAKVASDGLIMDPDALARVVDSGLSESDFATIEVFSSSADRVGFAISDKVNTTMVPPTGADRIRQALAGSGEGVIDTLRIGDVVRGTAPVYSVDGSVVIGAVVVSYYVPGSLIAKMKAISTAFDEYRQLKILKNPVKATYFMLLLIITLILVFFSIWIGRYIARGITVPIQELAEGTHAVASGNLDYKIDVGSSDEIGTLVKSFNRMTDDLKAGKSEIERANFELRSKNTEIDQRRRYIEIVLGNVPAGVVAIDRAGRITSINRMAAEMLGTSESAAIGKTYNEALNNRYSAAIRDMIAEMRRTGTGALERQVKLKVGDKSMTVLVNFNELQNENGDYIGTVAVLDDLTNLMKTQRMFAWKEVARRIAHEIKNPLTPIQLSAQRLRKKYLDKFEADGAAFDECTSTIIRQVDELKTLVNEFSSFARLPAANLSPNDLNEIVSETVALYRAGQRGVDVTAETDPALPVLEIDRDQIKRVIINLVDNALAALKPGGYVRVSTKLVEERAVALLEVADNGTGIPHDDKQRLFEPYFSTKHSGTGLGLAIVSNIVSDHNGYIRVRDNQPTGTRFTIELPIKAAPI